MGNFLSSMGLKEKLILGVILALIILIPTSSYVISYRLRTQSKAKADTPSTNIPAKEVPKTSPLQELKRNLGSGGKDATAPAQPEVFFGPTLSFKLNIEGRPVGKHQAKIFMGISQGSPTQNPEYLLSFNIDVPATGEFKGLSMAGLTQGDTYTAYIKAPAQIATSSAFTLKPAVTDLGLFNLLTGDLNEDNIINSADYTIARQAYGATPTSSNWVENADFNLDGIINNIDLSIILKHIGQTGQSGPYYSTTASQSGSPSGTTLLSPTSAGRPETPQETKELIKVPGSGGFWLWVPNSN
jgi:hypothetical protein